MYDLLIKNAMIVNGRNEVPYQADIAVNGDTIVKIGHISEAARRTIDAGNRLVTPGFIDIHCHSDAVIFQPGKNAKRLQQGFTTEVIGNCGVSVAPVSGQYKADWETYSKPLLSNMEVPYNWHSYEEYLQEMEKEELCLNLAGLVGHGAVRAAVVGFADKKLTGKELEQAKQLLDESLEAGAFGMSTGLIYPPGVYADEDEICMLAEIVKRHNGIYTTHIRSESYGLVEAVKEALRIAEKTGVSLELSHHKAAGRPNHGKTKITLELMREAQEKGLDVTCDVYPYDAASTNFNSILPPWALEGGIEKLMQRLQDQETRAKLIEAMKDENPDWESFYQLTGWDKLYISECSVEKYMDKTVAQIAEEEHADPFEKALDILLESRNNAMMIVFFMSPEDVARVIASPCSMICTDGFPSVKKSHPRYYGSCVRTLEKYVKQEYLLSLPQAIYKMCGMPAGKLGLRDRGAIGEGMKADLLVIDFPRLHDNATYENDKAVCDGIDYVIVNGQLAVDQGNLTSVYAGRVLRKTGE
ncbi:MAG: D-aminoacylase [Eubacteriales bacterium]|nr:D-aminoacylase [Eubacteriales bacterium]